MEYLVRNWNQEQKRKRPAKEIERQRRDELMHQAPRDGIACP